MRYDVTFLHVLLEDIGGEGAERTLGTRQSAHVDKFFDELVGICECADMLGAHGLYSMDAHTYVVVHYCEAVPLSELKNYDW